MWKVGTFIEFEWQARSALRQIVQENRSLSSYLIGSPKDN